MKPNFMQLVIGLLFVVSASLLAAGAKTLEGVESRVATIERRVSTHFENFVIHYTGTGGR